MFILPPAPYRNSFKQNKDNTSFTIPIMFHWLFLIPLSRQGIKKANVSLHWPSCLERKTRLELATLTLARLCSTNWAISAIIHSNSAQNRTRTCMPLDTRTWNVRVYHSATWAFRERKTRLELATLTLARLCSTNWAISAIIHSDGEGNETRTHTT